ncbi:MAG: hypothetical protein WCR06_07540 [bacterium]
MLMCACLCRCFGSAAVVAVLASSVVLPATAAPVIGVLAPVTNTVGRYQRFEVRVPVSGAAYTNAYDFSPALSGALLRATFTSPSGAVTTRTWTAWPRGRNTWLTRTRTPPRRRWE